MRGSPQALTVYNTEPTVAERPKAVLELNANAGVSVEKVGYYTDASTPTYTLVGDDVTGALFTTGVITRQQPIISGDPMTAIASLQYVDEPDKFYEELFSIKNVVQVHRPGPGIVKMATNAEDLMIPSEYARLYPCSRDDEFKYWRAGPQGRNPFVTYARSFWASKLKISVQNYAGLPLNYRIQVLPDGSDVWTTVWSQADGAWNSTGIMRLYYYDDEWTTTPSLSDINDVGSAISNAVKIYGVRILFDTMGKWNSGRTALIANDSVPVEVIEISPRLSVDVSESVISFETGLSLTEGDSPLPVGSISANDGSLTLENYSGQFSFTVPTSILYGHQPKQSVVDLYFETDIPSVGTETNRIMYAVIEDIQSADDDTVVLQLKDSMTILQTRKVKNLFLRNKRISFIVQTILDYVGVTGVNVNWAVGAEEEDVWIPYYYVSEETAYQALSDLAEAYQFSLSYDADNILQMFTKEALMLRTDTVDAIFTYTDEAGVAPNIVDIDSSPGQPVNDVSISYTTHWIDSNPVSTDVGKPLWDSQFEPALSELWAADEKILPSAPLVRPLTATDLVIYLDQEAGLALDYQGYVQVNAEVIAYDAKQFHLKRFDSSTYQYYWVESEEQYNEHLDSLAAGSRIYFTGKLRVPAGGRGAFESIPQIHNVSTTANYPYPELFNSYKTCPYLPVTSSPVTAVKANTKGQKFWDYSGGSVMNLRGDVTFSGSITRSGSESAIRMYNAPEADFLNFGPTAMDAPRASTNSAHWYLTNTPSSKIPYRVGAGVRILGRVDGGKSVSALGVNGTGGVGMFMRYTAGRMNGWVLEIRPTCESLENPNVRLFQVVESKWSEKASGKAIVEVQSPDVNTTVDINDSAWSNLDLAFYPGSGGKGGQFRGYVSGRQIIKYDVPTTQTVALGSYYGPYVRGDTYMDVDYVWWCDRSDPNSVDGYNAGDDLELDEFNIRDALNGTGGPPAWWDSGSATLYTPGATNTIGIFEFGPYVHAVSVIDADFGDIPAINPKVATIRGAEYKVPVFDSTPFGAKMVVVNARKRAVALAGDSAPFSIVGYKLETAEETYDFDDHRRAGLVSEQLEAKALASRSVHGYSPLEISTDLIQGKEAAVDLMNWVVDTSAIDCDVVELEVFGNPLLEPGDRAKIFDARFGYGTDQTFIIVDVSQSWDNGLTTQLTLRRVK